jgi:hypothetical protein
VLDGEEQNIQRGKKKMKKPLDTADLVRDADLSGASCQIEVFGEARSARLATPLLLTRSVKQQSGRFALFGAQVAIQPVTRR